MGFRFATRPPTAQQAVRECAIQSPTNKKPSAHRQAHGEAATQSQFLPRIGPKRVKGANAGEPEPPLSGEDQPR